MSVIKIKNYRRWSKYYDSWIYVLFHLRTYFKNRKLVKKYPFLLPRYNGMDKPKNYHYQWTSLDAMNAGWRKAFGKMMLDDIMEACERDEIDPNSIYVINCKEKWGQLRFELSNMGHNLQYVLDAYEQVSANVCWKCGKIDVPITDFGWIIPECQNCYVKDHKSAKKYEEMLMRRTEDECRIPDYYTVHRFSHNGSQYVNIDLTWITNRLRGGKK